jgi:hypothetical protein
VARRVIQFPVRNAFASPRSNDSLARADSRSHAERIVEQVEGEIARLAQRQATGAREDFEAARRSGVITLRPATPVSRFRKRLQNLSFSSLKARLFN